MESSKLLGVGDEVQCQRGDADCVLAPTHSYRVVETRRDANRHMHVRVKNSRGEVHDPWYPVVPHFLTLNP